MQVLRIVPALCVLLALSAPAFAQDGQCTPLAQVALSGGLTELAGAITGIASLPEAAGLASLATATQPLPEEQAVSIFAPNNAALQSVQLPEDPVVLYDVLQTHIVPGVITGAVVLEQLGNNGGSFTIESINGETLIFTLEEDQSVSIAVEGSDAEPARVEVADIPACTGPVHIITAVLVPSMAGAPASAPAEMAPEMAPEAMPRKLLAQA